MASTAKAFEEDQAAIWNGASGRAWVETQKILDRLFEPFEKVLVEGVAAKSARRVLDVGCGTGATTLAIARSLGADGRAVGIDISQPMIALARERAKRERSTATFVCADAEKHVFDAGELDAIVSRFGVMFFADPVGAFANLRRACRPGAETLLIAWRGPVDNPFMTTAERAAAPLLPSLPPRKPDAPGQFAFADRARVERILESAGWTDVEISPLDVACAFPASELGRYVTRLGPLGRVVGDLDEPTRKRVIDTVLTAFDPFVHGDEVRFDAACWSIAARAPR